MASVHKLSLPQLQRLIRQRGSDPAAVFLTDHCRQRMRQRQIGWLLVLDVLRQGRLHRPPEPDVRHTGIVCRMEHFVAGRHLAAAVALDDADPGVLVVTVIDLEK
jgi:hypothetical protein